MGGDDFSTMQRGVWQCTSIALRYCENGGSSRGAREFIARHLPTFSDTNKQLSLELDSRPGRHPHLEASYLNGKTKQIGIKNYDSEQVLATVQSLRDQSGRKSVRHAQHEVLSGVRSTQ